MNEKEIKEYAGNVLRRLIKEHYPSLEEFAFEFGVSSRNLNRWVKGDGLTIAVLCQLSNHFAVHYKTFLPD